MELITNTYIQYKPCGSYAIDKKHIKLSYRFGVPQHEPSIIKLEDVIKKISKNKIPTTEKEWESYCLDLVQNFGFLNTSKEYNSYISYEKESINKWKQFVLDLKCILKNNINDSNNVIRINRYLMKDTHLYFDDFHVKNLSYKCNSLASAIILYIITNKKHSKNCIQCNSIFFAKRSDALYCSGNCSKTYQRKNQTNKCLN